MFRKVCLFLFLAIFLFACSLSTADGPVEPAPSLHPSITPTSEPTDTPALSPTVEPTLLIEETQEMHAHEENQLEAGPAGFSHAHLEAGPHLVLASQPDPSAEDVQKAEEIVRDARRDYEKYRDYQEALKDGYVVFAPDVPQEVYHFFNYREALVNIYQTEPVRPTALLYRKLEGGWKFTGVMYSAPWESTLEELDARYPLSMGQWHAHVNICLPEDVQDVGALASDPKYGLEGSIDSKEECDREGGRFIQDLFGWMVHADLFSAR